VANYNVDIAVGLKGAQKLTSFNKTVKNTTQQIEGLNQRLKNAAKDQNLLVRSFDNLNQVLADATKNFNAASTGSQKQFAAARQLIAVEKELNKEYRERERVLQSATLKGQRSSIVPGGSLFGQSVTPKGGASGRSRQILQEEQALQEALGRMNQRFTGPGNITPMELTGQSETILRGQSSPVEAKIQKSLKEKQFRNFLKEKKANKEIRDIKAGQLKLERAQNRALKERVVTTRTLAKTTKTSGGGMGGGQGLFRGGARGALSNAMIGGGFPLLFGQGALGAAGGGIGGALGGAIGGGFGFSLSIIGTAIAQRIQEAIDFRKEIEKVNITIEKTGGSSKITATDITALSKSLKITKDEALQAANAFAAFGAQSALALAETFKDRSSFNLYANINKDAKTFIGTVDTLFQKNELGIKQAKQSLKILEEKGLKEAVIYAEAIKNEEKIRKEIDAIKPSKEDEDKANAMFLTYFDPQTAAPLKSFIDLNEEAQKQVQKLITNEGQLEERLGTVEERFKKRLDLVKQNIEAQREFNETVQRQLIIQAPKDELQKLLDPLYQVDALGKSIGASFSESFKGIVRGSMSAQDALRNLFMRTADHFLDMAAQMLAAQIRSGIFGLFKNFFTGGFAPPAPMNPGFMGTGIPQTLSAGSFNITGQLANGGTARSGGSYLVGERGPEMFTPGVTGTVTPNESLGGSTNIVVNVDASGSNVEGDEDQGRELGRLISVAVQSELIQQQRPGGLLA